VSHARRLLIWRRAQFAVFPSFILVTFSALLSDGHGGKTLYIPTSPVRMRTHTHALTRHESGTRAEMSA
jgi:hypothetical protein